MLQVQHHNAHRCQSQEKAPFIETIGAAQHGVLVTIRVADRLGTAKAGVGSAGAGYLKLVSRRLGSCHLRVPGAHLATPLRSAAGFSVSTIRGRFIY